MKMKKWKNKLEGRMNSTKAMSIQKKRHRIKLLLNKTRNKKIEKEERRETTKEILKNYPKRILNTSKKKLIRMFSTSMKQSKI